MTNKLNIDTRKQIEGLLEALVYLGIGTDDYDSPSLQEIKEMPEFIEATNALIDIVNDRVVREINHHLNKAQSNLRREFNLNRSQRHGMKTQPTPEEFREQMNKAVNQTRIYKGMKDTKKPFSELRKTI